MDDSPDSAASSALRRRHRHAAVLQANIARAGRVAQSLGPTWYVEIEDNVIRVFQGAPPVAAKAAPEDGFARGLEIVP
jgi:hypothetical protein